MSSWALIKSVYKLAANSCLAWVALVARLTKCSAVSSSHAPSSEHCMVFDTPTLVLFHVTVKVPSYLVFLGSWSKCFPKLAALICFWGTWSPSVGVGLSAWRSTASHLATCSRWGSWSVASCAACVILARASFCPVPRGVPWSPGHLSWLNFGFLASRKGWV